MKTINEITLYDLMAEDLGVWINIDEKFGLNMQIDDENGDVLMDEENINHCAAESFADFCQRYLTAYEKAKGL